MGLRGRVLYSAFGEATGDESGDPVEYADDVESFLSPRATVVARENIAILSRTLRLHTSSVLPLDAGLLITATVLGPSESVSESVLPTTDSIAIEHDDFIVVGLLLSQAPLPPLYV